MAADKTRDDTGRGSEAKRPVGGAQQGLPYWVSFAVVGVEQGGIGVAVLDRLRPNPRRWIVSLEIMCSLPDLAASSAPGCFGVRLEVGDDLACEGLART